MSSSIVSKQTLKSNLITIYNSNGSYDLITLYRKLRIYNDKIRLYTRDDIYQNYISELYNILDEHMYGENDIDFINDAKNNCLISLRKVIKCLK
jgi:hypothetical protein